MGNSLNSLKLYDENYEKLNIYEMTITYNGGDYIKFAYNNGFFLKKSYTITGITIDLNAGTKIYLINKDNDFIKICYLYTLDDKPLLCDKRIQQVFIKKDEYYIQLEN